MARDGIDGTEMSRLNSQASAERTGPTGASSPGSPLIAEHGKLAKQHGGFRSSLRLLFPWIWTIVFAIALIVVVKVYEAKGILTSSQKNAYSLISTGLILFLGLSFYEAFKELARALRYHLEHRSNPSPNALHLIKGFDGLLKVFQLTLSSIGWGLRMFCLVWTGLRPSLYHAMFQHMISGLIIESLLTAMSQLLINLIAQIAAAIISLTYTLDDGRDYNGTYVRSGQVTVSNLTCYIHGDICPSQITTDTLAHAYGDLTLAADSREASDCGYFTDVASVISSQQDFRYYCRRNTTVQEFAYRFNEYNPDDKQKSYPKFTDRVITASSGDCNEYSQVGIPKRTTVGDTNSLNYISAMNFTYTNNLTSGSIVIPTSALGNEGTTYIYRAIKEPAEAFTYGYGDRGIWMWAYRNPGRYQDSRFYECPITVSAVSNVRDPKHNITDGVAREAAASIALQGQYRGPAEHPDYRQWQWYADGHPWEIHYQNNSRVGANIAEHAIVSLAGMVARNPPIQMNGTVPHLGSKLSVRWNYFEALLAGIVAADSLVVALSYLAIKFGPCKPD